MATSDPAITLAWQISCEVQVIATRSTTLRKRYGPQGYSIGMPNLAVTAQPGN